VVHSDVFKKFRFDILVLFYLAYVA
jgi:hypothetical protein